MALNKNTSILHSLRRIPRRRIGYALLLILFIIGVAKSWVPTPANAGTTAATPLNKGFTMVATGNNFSCGISKANSLAYCWGKGQYGRLGTGNNNDAALPTPVSTAGVLAGKTIKFIDAGYNMACVIASDDQVYCWGGNGSGELGNNTTTDSNIPVAVVTTGVLSGKTVKQLTVGHLHPCVIASDNLAYCWGNNQGGQLGNNSTTASSVPVAVNTAGVLAGKTILKIASANFGNVLLQYHSSTCAIANDNKAYCWGRNSNGQLGNNSTTQSNVPVAVNTAGVLAGRTVTDISLGWYNTCAIADGLAFCWGLNTNGALGDASTTQRTTPVAVNTAGVLSGKTLTTITSGGYNNSCVLDTAGQAYCWGTNTFGELGNSGTGNSNVPVAVTMSGWLNGKTISQITTNGDGTSGQLAAHTCVVTTDFKGYCWGLNVNSQLGTKQIASGTGMQSTVAVPIYVENAPFSDTPWRTYANADSATPGAPIGATGAVGYIGTGAFRVRMGIRGTEMIYAITSGHDFSCGLASDGMAYCWGDNTNGQLGDGTNQASSVPVPVNTSGVLSGKTIKAISAGDTSACAIASDNLAYCWGLGTNGQLGNNGTASSNVPVAVDTTGVLATRTITSLSVGGSTVCAIANNNLGYCWGLGTSGQLGNAGNASSSVAVAVSTAGVLNAKTLKAIDVGGTHVCAIASDNLGYCWGEGTSGQLGNAGNAASNVAVAVTVTGTAMAGTTLKSISSGGTHTCVIASNSLGYCWGLGTSGQLGNNGSATSNVAVAVNTAGVLSGKTLKVISSGDAHSCTEASDSLAYCWGDDTYGQLGNGASGSSLVPGAVDTSGALAGQTISSIVASHGQYTCALADNLQMYCWGDDTYGQLGNKATTGTPYQTPQMVAVDTMNGPVIGAGLNSYKLQFAQRSAATCSAQITGYADVTGATAIAFKDNASVANGAAISSTANDPVAAANESMQTYQEAVGPFTNVNDITSGQTGMWDFSLTSATAPADTNYCLRIVYSDGTLLEVNTNYAAIITSVPVTGPTLDQQLRGGQGVVGGTKYQLSW